jgi:hypothetical protein
MSSGPLHVPVSAPPTQQGGAIQALTFSDGPSVHIDIQVHIASEASVEQIDQIFASMGKHLYQRRERE